MRLQGNFLAQILSKTKQNETRKPRDTERYISCKAQKGSFSFMLPVCYPFVLLINYRQVSITAKNCWDTSLPLIFATTK